jgi:hypothetical protein
MLLALFMKPQIMQHFCSPKIIVDQNAENFDMQDIFVSWLVWLWNLDLFSQWRTRTVGVKVGIMETNSSNRDDGCLLGR